MAAMAQIREDQKQGLAQLCRHLMAAAVAAVKLQRGIPDGDLMDFQPSHWRKVWPQGDTDRGEADDSVVERYFDGKQFNRRAPPPRFVMPDFEPDEDVVNTQGSLSLAEGQLGAKMDPAVVADRAMGVLNKEFIDSIGHVPKKRWNPDGTLSQADEFSSPAGI